MVLVLEISGDQMWCGVGVGVGDLRGPDVVWCWFLRGRAVVLLLVLVLEISGDQLWCGVGFSGDELWCCCWCWFWRSQGTSAGVAVGAAVVDRFYIALFSALKQTHFARM